MCRRYDSLSQSNRADQDYLVPSSSLLGCCSLRVTLTRRSYVRHTEFLILLQTLDQSQSRLHARQA